MIRVHISYKINIVSCGVLGIDMKKKKEMIRQTLQKVGTQESYDKENCSNILFYIYLFIIRQTRLAWAFCESLKWAQQIGKHRFQADDSIMASWWFNLHLLIILWRGRYVETKPTLISRQHFVRICKIIHIIEIWKRVVFYWN